MPILAPESDIYPSDLLESNGDADGSTQLWYALHTRPRQEKMLARKLTQLKIAHYSPQIEKRYRSPNGRRRVSYVPMFPGYIFARCSTEPVASIYQTNAVAKMLEVPDAKQLVFDLRQIRKLTHGGVTLAQAQAIVPGTNVRIKSGPFVDFEGIVVKHQSGDKLLVVVNYLQQGVSIEIGDYDLEKL